MIFYTICALSNFIDNPLITSFHSALFHGIALRSGKEYPHEETVFADSPLSTPLSIIRAGSIVPPIFAPSTNLVVNESAAESFQGLPHLRLQRVVFERLVDMAIAKGEPDPHDYEVMREPCEVLRIMPDSQALHRAIGPFYEVQVWRFQDFADRYPNASPIVVEEGTPPLSERSEIKVSEEILNEFPVFWFGDTLVRGDVFDRINDYLDKDYFFVREYDLAKPGVFRRVR